jgi:hypothetical protein
LVTWKELAYKDDVASLTDQAAHDIGTTASQGVATDAARHDHVHILGSGTVDNATIELNANALRIKADGVTSAKIAAGAVTTAKMTIDGNLAFGGYQATDLVLQQKSTAPTTPVVGKIYMDSDDQKTYICTVAT